MPWHGEIDQAREAQYRELMQRCLNAPTFDRQEYNRLTLVLDHFWYAREIGDWGSPLIRK